MTTHATNGTPFTPGPWSVDGIDTDLVTADWDGLMICWTSNADRDEDDDGAVEANARLIASAPELLSALETILACGSMHDDGTFVVNEGNGIEEAAAAVKKAKGMPDLESRAYVPTPEQRA